MTEEQLEGLALNNLRDGELEHAEEHLLVCPACQERLAETDSYLRAMREAARAERHTRTQTAISITRLAVAGALAAAGIVLVAVPRLDREAAMPVRLEAMRGASAFTTAPAGKALRLSLDINGMAASGRYEVVIVDQAGREVRRSRAASEQGGITAAPGLRLPAGRYFVRLYSASGELLREYGLDLQ